jgi:hypothetical protein
MSVWAQCVGGLILNFGTAEFQTLRWIEVLAGAEAALAKRRSLFGERISAAKELIDASMIPSENKLLAHDLWDELKELSKFRNQIAHNPLVRGRDAVSGDFVWSVIDLKKVVPIGGNKLDRLDYLDIQRVALRVGDISFALRAIIESVSV